MNARLDPGGLGGLADDLDAAARKTPLVARRKVMSRGSSLLGGIRRRAPRATGAYAGSWRLEAGTDRNGNPQAIAGTDHPAGFRLEQGYHGTDSLGRHYVQSSGQPHVAPAAAAEDEPLEQAALEIIEETLW